MPYDNLLKAKTLLFGVHAETVRIRTLAVHFQMTKSSDFRLTLSISGL